MSSKYIPTIGIETHVQLKTKTKLFSAVGNDARDADPNTLISHIDVGLPGALPYLNEAAVELASKAAFALNTEPQKYSYFERKHYFYPDLPMGYQISQLHHPIIVGGSVEIEVDGEKKTIGINRAQLEADAGKNTHPEGADYSLVDLNRAGTPLLEIVSEPEMHSSVEAKAYVRELYLLMKYADVSDVDLYHGNMRFDVNVSVSNDPNKPGIRTETKNLNSFRSVESVIEYEIKRQTELLEKGQEIVQETRGWDEAKQKTTAQRTKEEAHDYRYFPDPDLPPIELDDEYFAKISKNMPLLPKDIRAQLLDLQIDKKTAEDILEYPGTAQKVLTIRKNAGDKTARRSAFLMLHFRQQEELHASGLVDISFDRMKELTDLFEDKLISSNSEQIIYKEMHTSKESPRTIAERMNLLQVSDESEVEKIVAEVIAENQKAVEDVKNGEMKAIGFLVGQVMAKSKGKANPQIAQQLIKKHLGI